jgi:hypothetical protein
MDNVLKTELWKQFGAALDMFENAIEKCPESLWDEESKFWYITYHTLFWTDYYLSTDPVNFTPPEPYTLGELDPAGVYPDRTYTKEEMLTYLAHCRDRCRKLLNDTDFFNLRWVTDWRDYSMFEMQLYNMRHVQHHTGQLNLLLGEIDHGLPIWVSQTKVKL